MPKQEGYIYRKVKSTARSSLVWTTFARAQPAGALVRTQLMRFVHQPP
jgi:hypothetical protein